MSGRFEYIINLMCSNGPGSSTLEQHCSAMRMDDNYSWTSNSVEYALIDARADVNRMTWAAREGL